MYDTSPFASAPRPFDRRAIDSAWGRFTAGEALSGNPVGPVIVDSWERCRRANVDPHAQRAPHVGEDTLERLREQNEELLTAASFAWEVLSESLIASSSVLVLSDASGVLLDVRGNDELIEAANREHVGPGYDWSERASGTNAIGTALVNDMPTIIRSSEHYCVSAKIWDCAASPVRNLNDGTILGVLDVTSIGELSDAHTLALAVTAAHQIEHTLHAQELARSVQLLNWYRGTYQRWRDQAAVLLDRNGNIITASDGGTAELESHPATFSIENGAPEIIASENLQIVDSVAYHPLTDRHSAVNDNNWNGGVVIITHTSGTSSGARKPTNARRHGINKSFDHITTNNDNLIELMRRAQRMARANSPILLTGETGSGKELFARAIHHCSSLAQGPLVAVNCGTLSKELAASELLGYEPGAFTGAARTGHPGKFEEANGGTLFLDEIGELPPDVQVQLLRVLQDNVVVRVGSNKERQVAVRIIAATNRDLEHEAESERFRPDLYYRLKVLNLNILPLRERPDDIPLLVETFLRRLQSTYGLGHKSPSPDLLAALVRAPWPGNVRELHSLIESMYILSDRRVLTIADLPDDFASAQLTMSKPLTDEQTSNPLSDIERDTIRKELMREQSNLTEIARHLGISRSTLYRKMKQYGLQRGGH